MNTDTYALKDTNQFAPAPAPAARAETAYRAVSEFLGCELNGEVVILNLKNGKYYGLNPVGTRIWELVQTPQTGAALERAIRAEYDVAPEPCRAEVRAFLETMIGEGLIETVDEPVYQVSEAQAGGKSSAA